LKRSQSLLRLGIMQALTRQAALLFLVSILPVLLGVGWLNYQAAQTRLVETTQVDARARTDHAQQRLASVLLRELERLQTLAQTAALTAPPPAYTASARAAPSRAYTAAGPNDPLRQAYVANAAGRLLKAFREQYPNRAVALLADTRGGLEATSTLVWGTWDLTSQPWWPDLAHEQGNALGITRPVQVPGFDTPLLFLAVPVVDAQAQPIGVVAVGLKFGDLVKPLVNEDDQSLGLVTADDGTILYAQDGGTGQLPATWGAIDKAVGPGAVTLGSSFVSYAPLFVAEGYTLDDVRSIRALDSLNWRVVRVTPTAVAFAALNDQLTLLAAGTAVTALIVVLMALIVVRGLVTGPLRQIDLVIGDLRRHGLAPAVTTQVQGRLPRSHNEIGRLGQAFGRLIQELATLTQEREQTFAQQQTTVTSLRGAAGRLSSAAEEQQRIITNTGIVLTQVLAAFVALDEAAATIADYARQVASHAADLKSQHRAGETALSTTQHALADLQHTAQALEVGARSLAEDATAAGTLIEEANEVADTTHVLSLNAVIEAADAGQHGARFSVIAAEVRNLAAAASRAAAGIEETLDRMAEQTHVTADKTRQARQAIDSGAEQMGVLSGMMQTLLLSADELAEKAQRIQQRSEDQRSHSNEVHLSSSQLASAMQQVTQASRHVAFQAQELLELASVLDQARQPAASG